MASVSNEVRQLSSVFPCNNPDGVHTCTDAYSLVRNYYQECEDPEVLRTDFGKIEACMMKVCLHYCGSNLSVCLVILILNGCGTFKGRKIKLEGAEYDPRIGFRLKGRAGFEDLVFKCSPTTVRWSSVYLTPYYYSLGTASCSVKDDNTA